MISASIDDVELGDLGFSFKKFVKKAAKTAVLAPITTTKAATKASWKVTKKVGKAVAKYNPATLAYKAATKPLRSRMSTLVNRRANKIAWDRRKSKTPTVAERAEARSWAKSTVKKKGPHGRLLALFAGVSSPNFGEPVSTAAILAAVPALAALATQVISAASKSGQAPANPTVAPATTPEDAPSIPDAAIEAEAQAVAEEATGTEEGALEGAFAGFGAAPVGKMGTAILLAPAMVAVVAGTLIAFRDY